MHNLHEALYQNARSKDAVQCLLCPHNCIIQNGKLGICGTRKNIDGKLFSLIYGEVTAVSMDPIEKKPLYHFYPGKDILSIGTKGCNLRCAFCQNWHISQDLDAQSKFYSPEEIISSALKENSIGIAYTYTEPLIWFEYVLDCSKLARENGLKNILVTNGFINPGPLNEILEYSDAMNIDLKTFRQETYKKISNGKLSSVLDTIKSANNRLHIELTTLIVTDINDDIVEMKEMIDWISTINPNIPWHISRYHPSYKYNSPSTDIDFMLQVYDEAKKKLNFVFCGNISGSYDRSDTVCPSCNVVVISRDSYSVNIKALKNGKCLKCGHDLKIVND